MKKIMMITLFLLSLAGCTKYVYLPLEGDMTYNECSADNCQFNVSFPVDSILQIENCESSMNIFYGGKIFVIGEQFTSLWVGDIIKNKVKFKRIELLSSPITKSVFDWEKGFLKVSWTGSDNNEFKLLFNKNGEMMEE